MSSPSGKAGLGRGGEMIMFIKLRSSYKSSCIWVPWWDSMPGGGAETQGLVTFKEGLDIYVGNKYFLTEGRAEWYLLKTNLERHQLS